ncbi:hypothetical protein ACJX0J_014426, partial [Zea mays]
KKSIVCTSLTEKKSSLILRACVFSFLNYLFLNQEAYQSRGYLHIQINLLIKLNFSFIIFIFFRLFDLSKNEIRIISWHLDMFTSYHHSETAMSNAIDD